MRALERLPTQAVDAATRGREVGQLLAWVELWLAPDAPVSPRSSTTGPRRALAVPNQRRRHAEGSLTAETGGADKGLTIQTVRVLHVLTGQASHGQGGTSMAEDIDLKAAINAVSDVVQNRPRPLREFDQIYMKTGDMVMQSEFVASWASGKRLVFIGDGDSISVCVAYLHARGIINYGPSMITVLDFDERIVGAINRFADRERLENLQAILYNCIDALPPIKDFECFYTNPPWGASNNGGSVNLFVQRGIEAVRHRGEGVIVIADDDDLDWPAQVLYQVQSFSSQQGFFVSRMMPRLHSYHLDDAPQLRSCNLVIKARPGDRSSTQSLPVRDPARLDHFYGRGEQLRVRYVRERKRLDYGRANENEYGFELLQEDSE
jgi:predicted methyltransferase